MLVSEGDPPGPGRCPGCDARYEGGAERPVGAASALLAAFGIDGDPELLARGLFETPPDSGVAITSDRRDGFYAWWVFVAPTDDARTRLAALAETQR